MPRPLVLEDVRRLVGEGAQLVDVLAADEYVEAHIPGAVNLPLKKLGATSAERLDRSRAVIVYCHDSL